MAKLLSGTRIYGTANVDTSVYVGTSNTTTGTGGIVANTTYVFIGNNTINAYLTTTGLNVNAVTVANTTGVYTGVVNGSSITVGTSFIANTTGAYHTGTINAASHTVGTSLIANATGVYHTGTVNAASHTTGATGTGTGGITANVTTLFIGNNTINTLITSAGLSINGTASVANSTGFFTGTTGTGTGGIIANSTTFFVGNNTINTYISTAGLFVNNNIGINFRTLNATAVVNMRAQNDDNFVFYSTNTAYGARAIWSVFANSVTSPIVFSVPIQISANIAPTGTVYVSNGFSIVPYNIGIVSTGTTTPAPVNGNYQYITANGAFTIASPATDCAIDILLTNGTGAGTITFTGYTVQTGGTGDAYATTSTNKYLLAVRRINATSTYLWKALQ